MNRALALSITLLLIASSVIGSVELSSGGSPSSTKATKTILSPLQFQVNGKDPYVIWVPLTQGETISGDVNATGGVVTFSIALQGAVTQSEFVSGLYHYQFTASAPGTYELNFASASPVLVSVDVYSTR